MKLLMTAFSILILLPSASAVASNQNVASVAQKLMAQYPGISAGDIGLKCDPLNGAAAYGRSDAVACIWAFFRISDPAQNGGFNDAIVRYKALRQSPYDALARIDGIWVHLVLNEAYSAQSGSSVRR